MGYAWQCSGIFWTWYSIVGVKLLLNSVAIKKNYYFIKLYNPNYIESFTHTNQPTQRHTHSYTPVEQ